MDLRQRVAIGALGVGYLAITRLFASPLNLHERIAREPELVRWNSGIARSLSELLRTGGNIDPLLELMRRFREHDQRPCRTSSFHMNRLMNEIFAELSTTVRKQNTSVSTANLREQLYVEQDIVPVVRAHVEGVLHNHMLTHNLM